ncbi:hypothetical protein CKF54_05810 [Psittacicella hinzii]|uniref:Uncharacterized protein n=1 Tax=Psittacicella hinzii TaxID=2028575 RepID=A0A3A1Y305_9GAMM|nr:hypothetical protein [Psittacicella hinzii]RIY31955.1 hypothetical protein CKF54_05810 [Psittacicella hinzii]
MQTTNKPFFLFAGLTLLAGVLGLGFWSQSLHAFTNQSWHLFSLSLQNADYTSLWPIVLLGFMTGFIPFGIALTSLYFRRHTLKPRFFFVVINLLVLALSGWLIFMLTQGSLEVFTLQGDLKSYFSYSYALISVISLAWSAFYLAPLYNEQQLNTKQRLAYYLVGLVASGLTLGLALSIQQEMQLSLLGNAPTARYTVSLYGYAGVLAGFAYFIIASALMKFMYFAVQNEQLAQRQELEEALQAQAQEHETEVKHTRKNKNSKATK